MKLFKRGYMKKTLIAAAALLAVSGAASADYNWEGAYQFIDSDIADFGALGIAYHFNTVMDEGIPRVEAGFIRRSSNIRASVVTVSGTGSSSRTGYTVGGEGYVDDLYFAASYTDGSDFASNYTLQAGYFVGQATRLLVGYTGGESGVPDAYGVGIKTVGVMGPSQNAYAFEGGFNYVDDGFDSMTLQTRSTYYLNFDLGVFGLLGYTDNDLDDSIIYGAGVSWFPIPAIGLELAASFSDFDDAVTFGVVGRF